MPFPRLPLLKLLALTLLVLALLSCDQDLNSSVDQPTIDYVVMATDSATALPLEGVRVRVTTITGDTSSYLTSAGEGRAQLPTIASSRTLFELSRQGYVTRDTVDSVNAKPDTVFHRPIPRLLGVRLRKVGETSVGRVQVNVLPRDPDLNKVTRAIVVYEDSTGERRLVADTAGNGSIGLIGLKVGTTQVQVKRPGYLGHWFTVTVNSISDTGRPAVLVAPLTPLGAYSISGQVFQTTGSGNQPLIGARVEFLLKDSLAVPDTFVAFTSGDPLHAGHFEMDSVPALDGQILYFKDRKSTEPVKTVPISGAEVKNDGPQSSVNLTISSDSSLPYLIKVPGDSVRPNDSLVFQFNQRVDVLEQSVVKLINGTTLLADTGWNAEHTSLRIWLKDGKWVRGKTFQYELAARNGTGQSFTSLGDTLRIMKGIFSIPDSVGSDSGLRLPKQISFPYFNSGGYFLFNALDTNSSPLPDSSNQFARLRWSWSGTSGRKVDSLVVWYKDEGTTSNWALWGAYPGADDSASLALSDHYSTSRSPDPLKDPLPFRTGGRIFFRIFPKHQGKTYPDTTLDGLEQGMGPSVYSSIHMAGDTLLVHPDQSDSLKVEFLTTPDNPASAFDWGTNPPTPFVYVNDKVDATVANWHWKDNKSGRIYYKLPPNINGFPVIRVDFGQARFNGRPIWHRNRTQGFTLQ
jgi:hypothetical protein